MRICFLADPGSVNTRTWVDYFADRLGHEVHVISVHRTGELSPSVSRHRLGAPRERLRGIDKLAYLLRAADVARTVKEISPDLLVGYRVASYGCLAARTGFHPLVVAAQGERVASRASPAHWVCARRALREADLVVSWGQHMTERLVELGASPEKILTCPRGIDLRLFGAGVPASERECVVASTRALRRRYRLDVLLRALAIAAVEVPEMGAVVVGEGEDASRLVAVARRLGIADRVRFPGAVANRELPGLLGSAAIYASAIPTDGVSTSLLEAMACGAFPVVPLNAANSAWIEDGVGGRLVDPLSPGSYAEAFIRAWRDPDARQRAAVENRKTVEARADLDRNMRAIERAFRAAVDSRRGSVERGRHA